MNNIIKSSLLFFAVGTLAVSCADYNEINNFKADPDPTYTEPYKDLDPVKTYIDKAKYPNMTLGATLKVSEFNKQELAHAAAVTNFDNYAFGTTLMNGSIINNNKGVMNFLDMKDLLDHVEEIGGEVFGSPIVANANQCDAWFETLTAPVEIEVKTEVLKTVDYTTMNTWTGTSLKGKPSIVKNYDENGNALKIPKNSKVYIVEGFDVDPKATYTVTFNAKVDSDVDLWCVFADSTIYENKAEKNFKVKAGKWVKVTVEAKPAYNATKGYLMVQRNLNSVLYIKNVTVSCTPDNHRPMTTEEKTDTVNYALNAWCQGLMKYNYNSKTNVMRIKSFDLIDEALDAKKTLDNGYLDLKHSTDKIFWQDYLGSEEYAPKVAKVARQACTDQGGDASELKFFISETGLEDQKRFESLKYWIGIWDGKGANIDGINAKLTLSYSEDAATQATNEATLNTLLDNLSSTGKLIRLSNFDITYIDAAGEKVAAENITTEQRQKLADYYAKVINLYMTKIPNEKQAGLCKGNMADTSDPVGLWAKDKKTQDWVRTATYKAFCDALSGK